MIRGVSFAGRRFVRAVQCNGLRTFSSTAESIKDYSHSKLFASVIAGGLALTTATIVACDAPHPHFTPVQVGDESFPSAEDHEAEMQKHPIYTSEQVAENDGTDGKPVWMSYGGVVYDVTEFVANHPGGSEKVRRKLRPSCPSIFVFCFVHSHFYLPSDFASGWI
jgi:cytochrome b involved in lipid metabolism